MKATLPAVRPPTNDTEERLLDAALTLFAEKGYEAASVREIIEAAGVTRPVLYYYCASKEDLFKRLVHWKHDEAYRELGRIVKEAAGWADRLRSIMRGSFAFCAADPRVPRLMFQTAYGPSIPGISKFMAELGGLRFGIVCRVMQDGISAGEVRGRAASSLALIFCCLMDQHLNVYSRMPNPRACLTAELADDLVNVFLHGVAAETPPSPPSRNRSSSTARTVSRGRRPT
jgi:AcrR family transcriptional regulator